MDSSSKHSHHGHVVAGGSLVEPIGEEAYGVRAAHRARQLDRGADARDLGRRCRSGCGRSGPRRDAQGEHDGQGGRGAETAAGGTTHGTLLG